VRGRDYHIDFIQPDGSKKSTDKIAFDWKRLSDDDKLAVSRARKTELFLSQPMRVAEVFTGRPGVYVPLAETIRGFREILKGRHDHISELYFYMAGTIDEVIERARQADA